MNEKNESTKIVSLEIENVKRVKAVSMQPSPSGLTVIGGNNGQGKTSVLDAIAWALGGEKYRPSNAQREGSVLPPSLHIELSNGLVVERKGKNGDLKVIDPRGNKAGQTLLNEFISQFALDLPKFMRQSSKEKALTLLNILGIGDRLAELDRQENELYNRRHAIGQIADRKRKFAEELPNYPDAPSEPVSASELIRQQQDILARNNENLRKRQQRDELQRQYNSLLVEKRELERKLADMESSIIRLSADLETAKKDAQQLVDQSTAELEQNIADIEKINVKVRANLDKEKALDEAEHYSEEYNALTGQIESVRDERLKLLDGADLPLPGLSVSDGELTYRGQKWDCMSGSDQLIISTAIVRALNPRCGFVLMDKLEQLDADTLHMFSVWLQSQGLQVIGTRVSTGDECSIIITDGCASDNHAVSIDRRAVNIRPAPKDSTKAGGYWS